MPERLPTPERRRFALSSPSRPLDHSTNAARRDLADVALAGQWFAPHYAVPESWLCRERADVMTTPGPHAEPIVELAPGDRFAVLEISGDWAWGYREADRRVGYVRAAALGPL